MAELLCLTFLVLVFSVPLPSGLSFRIVKSGSMEPVIPVGALVSVVPKGRYIVGDVITFADERKTMPTTHRIVSVERVAGATYYRTKGDANEEQDRTLVSHGAVVGAVALTVPRLGYVLDFVRTERGFWLMVVVPAFCIMLDELFGIATALRARTRQTAPEAQGVVRAAHKTHSRTSTAPVQTPLFSRRAGIERSFRVPRDGVVMRT